MDEKVVRFTGVTKLDIPAGTIIATAAEKGLQGVVIVGFDQEGQEYFASSYADGADALWLLERAKFRLMKLVEDMSE